MEDNSLNGRSFGSPVRLPMYGGRDNTAEIDPRHFYPIPAQRSPEVGPEENLLLEYLRILLRRRWVLLLFALAGGLLALLLTFDTLPVYRARTSLDIQNINGDFMNMRAVSATGQSADNSDSYVQTQIKLLQSDALIERTVRKLEAEPHPASIDRDDLLSRIKMALHIPTDKLSYQALVYNAAKGVKVKPLGMTRLVEVTCDSWNAQFSAKFCNTLTSEFQEEDLETRTAEAQKTSEWLTRQLADVRQKAEESQRKLVDATGGNGLVLSQENTSVSEDRLRQMQSELLKAQADRMAKEAQSMIASSAASDSLPNVLDSPAYREQQAKLAELRGRVAELVPPLTEENPKVVHLRSEIREVEANLARERATMMSRMQNEYDSARHREALLSSAYHSEERNVSTELGRTSQVNLLRKEVESEQNLYQTLLQRAKEAGFASAMQMTTTRVVDAARAPKVPVSPRRGSSAGVGVLFGSLFGLGFVFFKERTSEVFRSPGDVERHLHVQELGVIPSSRSERRPALGASLSGSLALLGDRSLAGGAIGSGDGDQPASIAHWNDNFSVVAEAYRSATYSILLASGASDRAKTYVVSSPNASEGKTTVVSNLGVALSQSKRRVVLVDGDLRKPGLHRALGIKNHAGLRDILRGEIDVSKAPLETFLTRTNIPNLSIVPCGNGREEVVELLHAPELTTLIDRLSREFDIILIDTPPMLHMADARILAGHADGVILVFRARVTNRDQATTARYLFEHDGVRLIGTILNDFDPVKEGRGSYYSSYYRYKRQAEERDIEVEPSEPTASAGSVRQKQDQTSEEHEETAV